MHSAGARKPSAFTGLRRQQTVQSRTGCYGVFIGPSGSRGALPSLPLCATLTRMARFLRRPFAYAFLQGRDHHGHARELLHGHNWWCAQEREVSSSTRRLREVHHQIFSVQWIQREAGAWEPMRATVSAPP